MLKESSVDYFQLLSSPFVAEWNYVPVLGRRYETRENPHKKHYC
jgi:hypothetical protein